MQSPTWPVLTIGRIIILLVLIFAVLSLFITITMEHFITVLIIGIAIGILLS
jgi:hypothetical protein